VAPIQEESGSAIAQIPKDTRFIPPMTQSFKDTLRNQSLLKVLMRTDSAILKVQH
jgi:hypothetical protein